MASDNEACCESDPNFAVICGFLEKFGVTCGLANIDFLDLQYMLENNLEVPQELIDLHVKLLRKARKSVSSERWERAVIKFCHGFCSQDAWEIERFGYKKARLSSKLRILKELLEMQFDYNSKFKTEVNKQSAEELRTQPLGKDRLGHVYWYQSDEACQIRVYKEDPDEETWALVVRSRDDLVNLITNLNDGKETVLNEDSNSLESEKPIIDTGQTDSNSDSSKPDQLEKVEESPEESSSESKEMDDDSTKKLVESEEELKATESTEAIDLQMKESHQSKDDPAELDEKANTPTAMVSPPKTGINLRIKPIGELLSTSTAGIKEKYIRSEPSSILSFVHHRKAVDSAGFDVHANYLKRPLSEVEDDEVPAYIKRSRMDRPTLLGNKKKKPYSEEEEDEEEEDADEEEEDEVSDEIEEPLMLVKGEGSGHDNKVGNFRVVSEEIVEDVIYFHGIGSGVDCETGNDNKDAEPQSTHKSVDESQEDSINQDRPSTSEQDSGSLVTSKTEFKLGTIIDVRTNNLPSPLTSPIKRSRWDIGKPSETVSAESQSVVTETKKLFECSSADNNVKQTINLFSAFQETPKGKVTELVTKFEQIDTKKDNDNQDTVPVEPKRSMFFFGPGSLTVKPPNVTFKIGELGSVTSNKSDTLSKLQGVDDSAMSENADHLSQSDNKEVLPSETLLSEESVSDNVQVEKLPENVETVEPTTHTQELPEKVITDEVQNSEKPTEEPSDIQKSVDADQTTKTSLEVSDKIEDSINTDESSSENVVKIDELPKDTLINKLPESDKLLEEPTSLEVCQEIPFPMETSAVPSNIETSEEKAEPDLLAKPLDTTESLEKEKQSELVELLDQPLDTTEKSECIVSETKLLDDVIEESVEKDTLDATNKSEEKEVIDKPQHMTISLDVTDKSVDDGITKNVSGPALFDLEKPEQKLTSEDTLLERKPEDNSSPANSPKKSFLIDKILDTKIIETVKEVPKEVSLKDKTSIALSEGSNDEVKTNLSESTLLESDDGPDKSNEEVHEVSKISEDLLQNNAVQQERALEVGEKSQEPTKLEAKIKDPKLDNKKPDFSSTKVPEMINTPQVLATTEEIIKEVTSSHKDFIFDKAENISVINSFDCKSSADQLSDVCKTDDYKSNDLNTDNETLSEESERPTKNVATVTECKPKIQEESVNKEFNKEETQKTDNLSLISSKNKETVDSNATKDVLNTDQLNFVSSKPENAQASISHENTEKTSSAEILPQEQSPLGNNLELLEKQELNPTEDIQPNSSRQKKVLEETTVSSEELHPIAKQSESQKDIVDVPENDIHVNSPEVEENVPKEKSVINPEELNQPKDVQLPEVVEICKADSEKEVFKEAKVSSEKLTPEIQKEVPSISKEEAKPTESVQSDAVIASQTEVVNVPKKEPSSEQSKPTQNVLPELTEQKVVDLTKDKSLGKPESEVKAKAVEVNKNTVEIKGKACPKQLESGKSDVLKIKAADTNKTSLSKPESGRSDDKKTKAVDRSSKNLRKPPSTESTVVKIKNVEIKEISLSKPEDIEGGGVKIKALETKAISLSKPESEEVGGVKTNVTEAKEKLNLKKSESEKHEVVKNKNIETKEKRSSRKPEIEKEEGVKIKTVETTRKPESAKVAVVKIKAVDMKSTLKKTDSVKTEDIKINALDTKQTSLRGFESEKSDGVKSTTVNTIEINLRKSESGGEGDSAKVKAADLKKEENKLKHSKDQVQQPLDASLQDASQKVSHITKSKKRKSSVQLNPKPNISVQVEKKKEALEENKISNLEKNVQGVNEKLQQTTKDVLDLHVKSTKESKIVNVAVVSTVSIENNQEILDLANKSKGEITSQKLMDEPTSSPKKVKRNAPVVLDAGKTNNESNTSSIPEEVKPSEKSTKNADITDDKSSIGIEGEITTKSVEVDEANTNEVQVTRRSTRRTRSNTFDKPAVENKKESTPTKVEENKNVKKAKKSVEKDLPKPPPKVESEPVVETNKSETPKPNEIGEPPTRELRSRRSFPVTVKKAKAPTKASTNAAKKVPKEEEKGKVEDKNVSRSTRSNSQKGNPSKPVDLPELEKQITKAEVRPTKKFKMSESVENSPEKSESNKPNEEAPVEETPSPPRMRKTSARLRRNVNQVKKEEQAKTVEEPKVLEEAKEAKVTEESKAEEPKVTEESKAEPNVVEESKNKVEDGGELIPVVEPPCVEKKVALLTVVDTSTLKEPDKADVIETPKEPTVQVIDSDESDDDHDFGDDNAGAADDDSDSVIIVPEDDPLAVPDLETEASKPPPMTLATFKLDADDSPTLSPVRVTRKRAAQQSVDALRENQRKSKRPQLERKDDDSKRPKLKPKRSVDLNLRRSIEQQKLKEVSSSEDDNAGTVTKSKSSEDAASVSKRRSSTRSLKAVESDSETPKVENPPSADKKTKKTKRILLGLEISPEMENLLKDDTPVRQSRRIAQIKIKEEAERRKLEEVTLNDLKEEQRKRKVKKDVDKDYKLEKRKRNKASPTEDETTNDAIESDEKKKRKRKRKHWNPHKQFDVFKAWNSSSGSSSSEVEDEEEEIEEDDDHHVVLKSDHEFSPESDLEEGTEVQPLKRARTARKESDAEEEEVDDCACQKCGQKDHPEWILLCDSCDSGWHCSCLRPALLVIPEGDWFCPPCQHITLVKKLESQLLEYDKKMNKREMEIRRKERLAYVGISLDNVLPSKEPDEQHRHKSKHHEEAEPNQTKPGENYTEESGSDDTDSESESSSSTESDSDEPVYQLRERRQAHSYRFNDYDELINSAIQEEIDAVKGAGNQGRGKDIATIVNATQEEATAELAETKVDDPQEPNTNSEPTTQVEAPAKTVEPEQLEPEPLPPIVPLDTSIKSPEPDSEEEIIRPVKKKMFGKKKHRKLNSLDVSSGDDDADSDEDFKGNSSSDSEEGEEDYSVSESSDESRRGKRRKGSGPIRRSTRARVSRYDKDFINDTDSGEEAPRRKKTRSIWDESESEESDGSWGGRGKRKPKRVSRKKPSMPSSDKPRKSKKKKKRTGEDSDPEVFKKRPNIKFGGLNDDEDVGRRTRGKKINYLEALGSDSEDEMRRKPPRIEESEEEYIVQEDEEFKRKIENEKDSDESGPDAVLQDLAQMPHAKPKSRGRGKCGLKIPRKPKPDSEMGDMFSSVPTPAFHHSSDVFPPVSQDMFQSASFPPGPSDMFPTAPELYHNAGGVYPMNQQPPPLMDPGNPMQPPAYLMNQPILSNPHVQNQELHDIDDEPNPIEQINKNVEQMNEQEMEKMMEEEDYANKQLQLVALQLEKEKKRKEKEAQRLESVIQAEQKIPKKRGRKPKSLSLSGSDLISPYNDSSCLPMNSMMANNAELSEPPGISLPMFSEIVPALNADGTPRKRRGRGKGKKTLAAEAAALGPKDGTELEGLDCPSSSNSNTVSPAPDSPMHGSKLGIAAPPQPFSQSQPAPSVITRMLQSQSQPGAFSAKFFTSSAGDPSGPGPYHLGASGPRGLIPPGAYQQPPPGLPHYGVVRGAPPPLGIHPSGAPPPGLPPMYHAHRTLDPSPSGGGAITVSTSSRDRHSPSIASPSSSSPISKGEPTPPPPPYTRPQVGHFPPGSGSNTSIPLGGSRHVSMIPPPHLQHRSGSGNLSSPYHPGVPPNYHYGTYPPPSAHPPIGSDENQTPAVYPSAPYSENFIGDNGVPIPPSENSSGKPFEDDMGGEFVGLVSYFSSQREDDLDT